MTESVSLFPRKGSGLSSGRQGEGGGLVHRVARA